MRYIKITTEQIDTKLAEIRENLISKSISAASVTFNLDIPKDEQKKAVVRITSTAYGKILSLVMCCDKEIAWHGIVNRVEGNIFQIEDIIMFDQVVTAATVDTDEAKYGLWLAGLPDEQFNKLRFHGHSHVKMACNPSATDLNMWSGFVENDIEDFYIFAIFNKNVTSHFVIYDIENNIKYESTDIVIELPWALNAIEQHVTTPPPVVATPAVTNPPAVQHSNFGNTYGSSYYGKQYDDDDDDITTYYDGYGNKRRVNREVDKTIYHLPKYCVKDNVDEGFEYLTHAAYSRLSKARQDAYDWGFRDYLDVTKAKNKTNKRKPALLTLAEHIDIDNLLSDSAVVCSTAFTAVVKNQFEAYLEKANAWVQSSYSRATDVKSAIADVFRIYTIYSDLFKTPVPIATIKKYII